jgi:serine/threonine protein kinase
MAHVPPKLGPFEPLHRLGAGGMAETFLAVRRGPGGYEQRVCIKRILPAYESDRDFVESFLDEARTSATLRHTNIVSVVEFGLNEDDGSHYLALELVDGMDLRMLIQREQLLDAELVTLIAGELSAALAYAHADDDGRAAIVHRDLSPSNVLISRAGEVKLTDFGIARVTGGVHRTASGVIKGKVPYMPPEYVDGGHFDARGDLFSLGVLLFELCHGYRPFDGDNDLDTMRRLASGERRPFEAPAPSALRDCIERLLQRRPEARFTDAQALLDALPSIAIFPTRKRLANLVRGRPTVPPALTSWTADPLGPTTPATQQTLALSSASAQAVDDTRTAAPRKAAARARIAPLLVGATLALLLAGSALWWRVDSTTTRAAAPSAPPPLPAPPPRPITPNERTSPVGGDAPSQAAAAAVDPPASRMAVREEPRRAPSVRVPPAELRVVVYPFGDIWVDGKLVGPSPLTLRLPAGSHEIAVGEGRARERRTVHLHAGESESLTFRSQPQPE